MHAQFGVTRDFSDSLTETVRKVPTGSEPKPHKSMKRSKKPNLGAPGTKNVGFSGYSRPFSDSFPSTFILVHRIGSFDQKKGAITFQLGA